MKQILFSCLGTTDPVRGEHDGPMLHILRHYRPEGAYLFLTPEIREMAGKDSRFEKTGSWIAAHWGGYRPEIRYIDSSVRNAHDIDELDRPLYEAMALISRENPDAEILINLTSGTPQMQMILSQMAMDIRFRARGVQVSNFEKSSGRSQRTNQKGYDIDLELEFNEDEQPGAENRCTEPAMYTIRREYLRRQITALLDERNFVAVAQLSDSIPENLGKLTRHLAARSRLQTGEAMHLAGEVKDLPFRLYAYKTGSRAEYSRTSEYYLLMKNLAQTGNYTEFLLHLEPLTLTLQLALLDRLLQGEGCQTADFIPTTANGRKTFEPFLLQSIHPALYQHYEQSVQAMGWEVKRSDANTYLCDVLLSWFPNVPEKAKRLFEHYDCLKDLRNRLAHTLCTVTKAELRDACGTEPEKLLNEIEGTIIACYPACDPVIFSVYDKSMEYIKANL